MDGFDIEGSAQAAPQAPARQHRGRGPDSPLERQGQARAHDRNQGNEKTSRRIEAAAPHRPDARGGDHTRGRQESRDGQGALPAPELDEAGKRQDEDRRINEKAELLIEEKPGQALGKDVETELPVSAIDPPRIEEAP